ncbi:MAG: alpha/beta fold hydrolase [candidate division Zixibacteria bacterium]|nr:alpha/beta fold hydrolase [candidate division Zixibacteria bacterium]
MAKLSQNVKEIIKTAAFLIIVGILIFFFMIYPLNRTKATMGRSNIDDYNPDSLVANDISAFIEAGICDTSLATTPDITFDTFRVETDGLTNITCLHLFPSIDKDSVKGTVFLLHDDGFDRDAVVPMAQVFIDSGFNVVAYDQRGAGRSTGKYRGEGQYEANDLQEIIRYLDLRNNIVHPLVIVGKSLGADAALLCAQSEERIDGIAAISPYLSSTRWLNILKQKYDMMWFPFSRTIMWWWYNIRSSYAAPYRELKDIRPVNCPTLLIVDNKAIKSAEVVRLKELSKTKLLHIKPKQTEEDTLFLDIFTFVEKLRAQEQKQSIN